MESFRKVDYQLRPRKQVERRMLIDAFHRLSAAGFPVANYQYTGMGSIFFVDYILFHKFLGIHSMLSAELSTKVKKRLAFNKPYDFVEIFEGAIGETIEKLDKDRRHILWLDYDQLVHREMLADVQVAASQLSVGSILLVTVDSDPPVKDGTDFGESLKYFRSQASEYTGTLKKQDCSPSNLPRVNATLLWQAIEKGLEGRKSVTYANLFNFEYADGHRMVTIGGMIVSPSEQQKLKSSDIDQQVYFRSDVQVEGFEIRVPQVTRKERLYLDTQMPCDEGWLPQDFEFSKEDVQDYRKIYRFYPAFAELIL